MTKFHHKCSNIYQNMKTKKKNGFYSNNFSGGMMIDKKECLIWPIVWPKLGGLGQKTLECVFFSSISFLFGFTDKWPNPKKVIPKCLWSDLIKALCYKLCELIPCITIAPWYTFSYHIVNSDGMTCCFFKFVFLCSYTLSPCILVEHVLSVRTRTHNGVFIRICKFIFT